MRAHGLGRYWGEHVGLCVAVRIVISGVIHVALVVLSESGARCVGKTAVGCGVVVNKMQLSKCETAHTHAKEEGKTRKFR